MSTQPSLSVIDKRPAAPAPDAFNLAAHVLRHADTHPDKIALAVLGPARAERWSYGKLASAVRGMATGLLEQGFAPGDKLLFRLGNTPDFPLAFLACAFAGLIPVPTSAQLTLPEIERISSIVAPKAALCDSALPCPADLRQISVETLRAFHTLAPAVPDLGAPNRLAYIVMTSGTSGTPRAVAHAHRALWARAMMHDGWYGMHADDRILHAGAFNWTFTLGTGLLDPWSLGATALIPAPGTAPEMLGLLLKRHDASLFAAAPGVFRKLLASGRPLDLPKLRHALAAGEKLSDPLRTQFHAQTGKEIYEAYGLSECSTFISANAQNPARDGCLGHVQNGRCIALADKDGPVPWGSDGEIAIHRDDPGLMLGYLEKGAGINLPLQGEWFMTGDRALIEQDGQVRLLGRSDDMMNAGGFRVSPLEIEAAMADAPGVATLGVCDVEAKPGVHIIAMFYTSEHDIPPTELGAWAEARLARYKQPRHYQRLAQLPTGANGKLSRRALRTAFCTDKASAT